MPRGHFYMLWLCAMMRWNHHSSLLHLPWCSGLGARRDTIAISKSCNRKTVDRNKDTPDVVLIPLERRGERFVKTSINLSLQALNEALANLLTKRGQRKRRAWFRRISCGKLVKSAKRQVPLA